MSWRLDAITATSFQWAGGQTGQVPHGKFSHTRSPGQSPHIPQGKGVLIATQTRHSGFDTSSVARVGVCMAHDEENSSRSVMRSQTAPVCGEGKRPGSTHKGLSGGGDRGRWSRLLRDGPSSRVAVTRDHASLPLSRKTADTTEHTLLHPQAPRTQQEFTRARQHSAQHQRARHELLSVRGRSVVVFRSASASPTSSLVSSARVVRPSSRVAVTRDHASLPLSRKTADTTEHTLLHPQAPRTQQEFTRARQHSAQHQRARHELLSVRGRSVVVFRSVVAE